MKLKMAPNSLFAILLRSPWWASLALAVGLALLARLLLPAPYVTAGMLGGAPFVVIAAMAAWRQARTPNAAQTAAVLQRLQTMSAHDFGAALEAAFRSQGYEVSRHAAAGADLVLSKAGQRTLVCWRRWKAASTGVDPLRELQAAQQRLQVDAGQYIAAGDVSDKARVFASQANIRLMDAAELVQLLHTGP